MKSKSMPIGRKSVAVLLAVAAMVAMSVAHAAPGDLDPGFGTGGKLIGSFGNPQLPDGYDQNDGMGIARDAAGDVYVGGTGYRYDTVGGGTYHFGVAKFDQSGNLVTSFGNGGRLLIDVGPASIGSGKALVVAGSHGYLAGVATVGNSRLFAVCKFNLNGQLVASFGTGGVQTVSFGATAGNWLNTMTVDPAGNVFLAGEIVQTGGNHALAVAKLDSTGAPVPGFGTDGKVAIALDNADGSATALALDGNGGIYVAGYRHIASPPSSTVVVYHLDVNGAIDTGFNNGNNGGSALFAFSGGGYNYVQGLVRADNGDLYLAGTFSTATGDLRLGLAKLGSNGVLASGFGTNGMVRFEIPGHGIGASSLALDQDGSIYVAGTAAREDGTASFLAAQFDGSNGNVVGTFGSAGFTMIDLTPQRDDGNAMLLDGKGHLYVAGTVDNVACVDCMSKLLGIARLFVTAPDGIFKSGFEP